MFKFKTTAWRVVNRFGLSIKADNDGIIETDNKEIADIMNNMGFEYLSKEVKEVKEEKEEVNPVKPLTRKRNAKV